MPMNENPTSTELMQRIKELEKEVADNKATIEELRHSATVKQLLLDDSADFFLRVDRNRRIIWGNMTAAKAINLSPWELKGLSCHKVLRNTDKPCQDCPCRKAIETGQTEYKLIHRPADSIADESYWEHYGVPVKDESGQIVGVNITARDVTHRIRAEQALRKSEGKMRSLLENSPDFIINVDRAGTILFINHTVPETTVAETIGKSCYDYILPEYHAIHRKTIADVFATGKAASIETKGMGPGGQTSWYETRFGPVMHDGQVDTVLLIATDITQRKLSDMALQVSERRYHNVYDTAPLAFVIWDRDCRITDWNRHAEKTFGWSADEVIGRNFFEFLIPEGARPRVEKIVADLLQGILPSHSINENLTRDGRIILCEWNNSIRYDVQNQIAGGISLALEITEKKRAEERLRESEEKYSSLVENSLTGIYIDQEGKIVFANKKFADIYGYHENELTGIESWKLVHPEDRPVVNQIRAGRMQGENVPAEYEARGLTKDGKAIWILRRNTRIDYGGRPAILGNIEDITQQKWAEEELHRINEELKDLIHAVSHDLKNPLIAIQGFSARLLKNYQEKLGNRGQDYLEHINTSVHRIEALVADLLTLSKMGRIVSSTEDVSCSEVVNEVAAVLQNRLQEKGIQLAVAPDLPVIRGDKERMYQIFENLLVNATKFTGTTSSPKIEIGYEDHNGLHQFFVRDNGIGIDPKYHRKIFEKFHRLKQVPDDEGTGLGLAIVHRIVTNCGGKVWVESEKDKGATFYFTLPRDRT
jgi:PAS domain S-box-containing protein